MDGFDPHDVPGWLLEAFDERTTLPIGPLDRFPIPLEGHITGGKALVPKSGTPARYVVNASCKESLDETVRFFNEYLPLAGYILFGQGTLRSSRNPLSRRRARPFELLLLRRPPFVGTVLLSPSDDGNHTLVEADLAHPHHPDSRNVVDFVNPRSHSDIRWHYLHEF